MSEIVIATTPAEDRLSSRIAWLLVGVFVLLGVGEHYFFALSNGAVLKDGGLVDSDSYMRVLRILDLYNGAGWYDTVTPRLGAPEGLSLHWTRPVDVLILLPALLAHLCGVPMDRAVYWVGAAFSSVCHILACLAAAWAARPLWPSPGHRFAALILVANAPAFGYGVFGRADHHTLLLLLTALLLGCAIRFSMAWIPAAEQRRWAAIGGVFAGLGVWVSPEFLVPVTPVVATLGLFWLDAPLDAKERGALRDWAGPGAAFSLAMAAVILLAIPIEQPPSRWLAAEYDKVSLPYLVLPLLWAAVFLAAQQIRGGFLLRLAAGAVLGLAGGGLLLALFPDLLFGPLGVDDRLKTDFLDTVREMTPLWPTSLDRLKSFLPMVGQSIATIILLPFAFRIWRGERHWAALMIALCFGFLLIGAMMHARLGVEFAPTTAIIGAGFFRLAELRLHGKSRLLRTPALVLVATVLTCGPLLTSLVLPAGEGVAENCRVKELAAWLNEARPAMPAGPPPAPRDAPIIMTDDISFAPELAFRTPYRFVAGPYHRDPQAIFDTIDAMTAVDAAEAKRILDRRQVSLVVRCGDVIVPRLFDASGFNLYARLGGRGTLPDWLTPLPLPPELGRHFNVYEVKGR
jgi:hypothetical protein